MHEDARGHAIAVDAVEAFPAALGVQDQPYDEEYVQQDDDEAAHEAPFLAHGAEDEVGGLFRDEAEGRLRSLQETLAGESAGADGDLGLVHVVAHAGEVLLHAEEYLDAGTLVFLEDVLEDEIRGENEDDAHDESGQ